ncbi:Dihydroorotate dehydrogenase B (NAD(+)), catalytic subunit [subsurface metagenome]
MNCESLRQKLFGLEFKNPVLAASGTFGYGEEFSDFFDVTLLGGFVTKAVTPEPRKGNPPPRIIETPSGMLNAIGLQNDGLDVFVSEILPRIESFDTNVIVNVAGQTVDDYVKVCSVLDEYESVRALEINISCPNVKEGGMSFGCSAASAFSVVRTLRDTTDKPLIIKLTPNVTDISEIARSVEDAGADAVSLINTITGMAVDVESRSPMLANVTGGLSGPAIRPVAVRMVFEAAGAVSVPVIGMGGIFSARDALEFIIAGASLVQIGCGMFVKPRLPLEVIDGISDYMVRHDIESVTELVGSIKTDFSHG